MGYKAKDNRVDKQSETNGSGQYICGYQREERRSETVRSQIFGGKRKFNFGWRTHNAIYIYVLLNCTFEAYLIFLTNATPKTLIIKKRERKKEIQPEKFQEKQQQNH